MTEEELPRRRNRKPLSSVGGKVFAEGNAGERQVLADILTAADEEEPDHHTHGFHTYPGRLHPGIAAGALRAYAKPKAIVLDPFCGSGTVLVEAMLAGLVGVGIDVNPIGLRISEVKCSLRDEGERTRFVETLEAVGEASTARVRARVDSRADLPARERAWYEVHVLKELAGLRAEIEKVQALPDRRALEMVFSAIVVKFSRQDSDTVERQVTKRIRKGLVTEFFVRRGRELSERWQSLFEDVPPGTKPPRLVEGSVTGLAKHFRREHADLIVTSPPYGGTFDYVDHHARRYPWLGIDTKRFSRQEIGSRRKLQGAEAPSDWDRDLTEALSSMVSVATTEARFVLMLGDAHLGGRRVAAVHQLNEIAPRAGLRFVAAASQHRPDWRGGAPRAESLILLARA